MGKPNTNAIDALPHILKRLSNGESLYLINLSKQYNAPITTLRDNIKKHIVNSFPDEITYSSHTNTLTANKAFLSETLMTAKEIITMSILENSSSKYGDNFHKNTKLLFDRFKKRASLQIFKKTNFEKITREHEPKFAMIKNAIKDKDVLSCTYNDKPRIIYPLKIVMFDGYWYALVYQESQKKIKTFHLKTISDIKNENRQFDLEMNNITLKLNSAINAHFKDKKPIPVELLIHVKIAKYFERRPLSNNQDIQDSEDINYKRMIISVTNHMEIIPIIQQFIPFIKVLSPDSLDQKIRQQLNDYDTNNLSSYFETD